MNAPLCRHGAHFLCQVEEVIEQRLPRKGAKLLELIQDDHDSAVMIKAHLEQSALPPSSHLTSLLPVRTPYLNPKW